MATIGNLLNGGLIGGLIGGVAGAIGGLFGHRHQHCHQQFGEHGNEPSDERKGLGSENAFPGGFMQGEHAEEMQELRRHMQSLGGNSGGNPLYSGALASGAQLNLFMSMEF
jgi:hypothetical protein